MSKEFKRIFIIKDYSKVVISEEFITFEQFYLNFSPRIRCRKFNDIYTLAVKVPLNKHKKIEVQHQITKDEYEELRNKRVSKIVNKQRHDVRFGDDIGIYDEFFDDFDLKILSMEFADDEELMNFKTPDFLEDVGDILSEDDMKR